MSFINSILKPLSETNLRKMLKLCNLTLKKSRLFSLIALTHDELRARTALRKNKNESRGNRC
jgi:hypothetical protein